MRSRILAVAALAAGLVVAVPGVASASGESVGVCIVESPAGEEIVGLTAEELEEEQVEALGEAADECVEAPNPVVPEINELIWGGIFFLIVLVGLMKFAVPALKKGMADREERIRDDLEQAEKAKVDGQEQLSSYEQQLADAREEAARIIEEARASADGVRQELIAQAEQDAAGVRERANVDIAAATERATSDLQAQVGELAIELAEKVVEHSLDHDTQTALIENYINEVGSSSE
ncbi:MAG: F0F1 ATP synthase subunit B [Acidimicrobiia bacterium]|nr:F0F1 ATP synthase subunit B [Acidimicrobiia bacterium]